MAASSVENKVIVNIYGDDYPITGITDPGHISKIADYVDAQMKDIAENSRVKSKDKVAILTAMSIASELYEKKEILDQSDKVADDRIDKIITLLDNALKE